MKNRIILLYAWFVRTALFIFPDVPLVSRFRGFLYGIAMKKCGPNLIVQHDAIIRDLQNLEFGRDIRIANHVAIWGSGKIVIEDCVIIGPHAVIVSGNHTLGNGSFRNGAGHKGVIILKEGSWVAANSTVCAGSVLPERSVLGANSMMNKAFTEQESIYGGVPARFIKNIEDKNDTNSRGL